MEDEDIFWARRGAGDVEIYFLDDGGMLFWKNSTLTKKGDATRTADDRNVATRKKS